MLVLGKTEFGADEDAHVVGDCVKVIFSTYLMLI